MHKSVSSNQGDSCPSFDITTISSITILMYKKGKEVMKYRSTIWLLYPLARSTLLALEFVQSTLSKCTLSKCTLSLNARYFRFPTSGISDKCTLSLFCTCNRFRNPESHSNININSVNVYTWPVCISSLAVEYLPSKRVALIQLQLMQLPNVAWFYQPALCWSFTSSHTSGHPYIR